MTEIKSLMNKVHSEKATGMDTERFEEKIYKAETSIEVHLKMFSQKLIEQTSYI